jgi:hypothetical protein
MIRFETSSRSLKIRSLSHLSFGVMSARNGSKIRRRFAPLNPQKLPSASKDVPTLEGIVFDVDGTLCM